MKCPHCGVAIHEHWTATRLGGDSAIGSVPRPAAPKSQAPMPLSPPASSVSKMILSGLPPERIETSFWAAHMSCPECKRAIVRLSVVHLNAAELDPPAYFIYPRHMSSRKAPTDVPADLAEDFDEAATVLPFSAKASAALSRRCLQGLLRAQGYQQHDLAKQIDAALASRVLPSGLADSVDAIRNIGNFGAHPMKDSSSGQILPVEPHEAEWNLDVLEGLFDFFYSAPAREAARKAAFNAKLAAAGKPPIK